ncbi:hypothetical protein RMA73_00085 (plasmid) [Xanthomonas translucens pv. translucens]|uniref:hypothetical protein n=1 Tax=Xanthomonas campestris pv. translucens TaxID=343 RepID=UPI0019D6E6AA|nr:hypothetical protein [Xanthomonas translucens]MCT8309196.1 hypothetical protein [Xanthomonas translucens pv. translucens]QSQ54839.1 hypothetical protein ISN36_19840 [Xanthomonas translucens pv. undulosa]QSQ62282.1 hypothetical protein ISN38_19910 [Xanthomonas translucens pv. undulosa]WNJ25310.1 hypothetical protein RMA73_00330 [Xanthomonas translucens pv. translucens]WNJ25357.1 hypothetical protein RMA73_00085 [Xanthomonas translucens pv. translucens]
MSKIAIYIRNETGAITYKGEQHWDSRAQVIEHYYLPKTGDHEQLVGWPHSAITWHGDHGFGEEV